MKLKEWAKIRGIGYRAAWNRFKAGKIEGAYMTDIGTIIVPDIRAERGDKVAVYARVSSSENKSNLLTQSKRVQDFCIANGWIVSCIVEECGSGLNDERPKLIKLLKDKSIAKIVVEHKDRLTRFGFNYLNELWGGEIIVINEAKGDEEDLMQDFVSLVTSFTARLYGKRRTKRATEKIIKSLKDEA